MFSMLKHTSCEQPTKDYSALGVAKAAFDRVRIDSQRSSYLMVKGWSLTQSMSLSDHANCLDVYEHGTIKNFTFILKWSTSGMEKTWDWLFIISSSLFLSMIFTVFYVTHSHMSSALPFWERIELTNMLFQTKRKSSHLCQHKIEKKFPVKTKKILPQKQKFQRYELEQDHFFCKCVSTYSINRVLIILCEIKRTAKHKAHRSLERMTSEQSSWKSTLRWHLDSCKYTAAPTQTHPDRHNFPPSPLC